MVIGYETLRNNITTAIAKHLLDIDALPPSAEVKTLARNITEAVFTELNTVGLTKETLDNLEQVTRTSASASGKGRT
jgi:hypothetical protein